MSRLAVFALYALMLAGLLILTGCASAPASTVTAVPLPVQCPVPVQPPKPALPIDQLKTGDSCEVTQAAYAESLNVCIRRVDALEKLLKGYQP